MSLITPPISTLFQCHANGVPRPPCSFEEAKRGFLSSHIGYLVPPGYYRYAIDGYKDEFYFANRGIHAAESEFAFELHRRRCAALTLDDLDAYHEDGRRFQPNTLAGRASRFFRSAYAAMPPEQRPYHVVSVPGSAHKFQPGYILKSGITYFMIVDQAWTGSIRPYFDWSLFLDSPAVR